MGADPNIPRMSWARAVATAEVWIVFAASAAAVFVTLGATAGAAYAARLLVPAGGR